MGSFVIALLVSFGIANVPDHLLEKQSIQNREYRKVLRENGIPENVIRQREEKLEKTFIVVDDLTPLN